MVIGIDLGTTNSVVYTYKNGMPEVVNVYGRSTTPSVVGWHPKTKEIIIGDNAKKRVMMHPETIVVSNKKNMGRVDFYYEIMGNKYTPIQISSYLLRYLVDGATETLGEAVDSVVITVPAYFNSRQRLETREAAELAGLKVLGLIDEPTAAAVAYGVDKGRDQTILVYDLGGGTFDISILKIEDNNFREIGKGGDVDLGGDDFDGAIMDYLYKTIKNESGIDLKGGEGLKYRTAQQKLKEVAEDTKITLSSALSSEIYIVNLIDNYSLDTTLTRDEYKRIILPFISKTIDILRDTMASANISPDEINRVICVGGSTKSPIVRDVITKEVKQPFMASNVDEIVAKGSAIYAASLSMPAPGSNLPVIKTENVISQSFGIRTVNDDFSVIIPKNARLPLDEEKTYTTHIHNAVETEIEVFQGDEKKCSNNIPIGGFTLKGIQKAKAGVPQIKVKFTIDNDGILNIEAKDATTSVSNRLTIDKFEPKYYVPNANKSRSLDEIRIGVSRIGYDDVGAILTEIGLPWSKIQDEDFAKYKILKNYDVVFINCLAGGDSKKNKNALRKFVEKGGVLYASDCAKYHLEEAFPEYIDFTYNAKFKGDISCTVMNSDFESLLSKNKMNIHFNSVLYYASDIKGDSKEIYLRGDYAGRKEPVTVGFEHGEGHVIFTAFHNYGSATLEEKEFLKFLVLKPISIVTKTPLVELASQI